MRFELLLVLHWLDALARVSLLVVDPAHAEVDVQLEILNTLLKPTG